MNLQTEVNSLFQQQLATWPLAQKNFQNLRLVQTKTFDINGIPMCVQYNPARLVSSGAKLDAQSIAARKCFLCAENRPAEQRGILWRNYTILVNPFPIFPAHFTIPRQQHVPQQIKPYFADMLALARELPELLIFYNGPHCGASAPDHMHFQAGTKNFLPLINYLQYNRLKNNTLPAVISLVSSDEREMKARFGELYAQLQKHTATNEESMLNVVCLFADNQWFCYVLPRKQFRPWQYSAEGDEQLLVSPGTAEMCGMLITPIQAHFERISAADVADIFRQTSLDFHIEA